MRAGRLLHLVLLLVGCYRESSTTSVTNTSDPALLARDTNCERGDDTDADLRDVFPEGRLRSNFDGALGANDQRTWQGREVPTFVPMQEGTKALTILDEADGGYLAFYRDPYGAASCTLSSKKNCEYQAVFYDRGGKKLWSLSLGDFMSAKSGLEVQDIRVAAGTLLFNEACQSYSSEQNGKCSSLVAVDPVAGKLLWRTPSLVSNGRFAVRGCYVLAGYGFTSEPDNVFLVERATGKVTQKIPVSSAPQSWRHIGKDKVALTLYAGNVRLYKLQDITTRSGRIVELDAPEFGGAAYGGYGYGGNAYGGSTYGYVPRKHKH